ncbi:unknown [Alistipes sp. CAG:831]|nr:unknown [Alistipes sp. CAG:831]
MVRDNRTCDDHHLLRRSRLPRPEGRTGLRGRHTYINNSGRTLQRIQAQERLGRECHHPVHWSLLRRNRGRSHLHPPRPVHPAGQIPGTDCGFLQDIPQFPHRRRPRHPAAHSFPQILRKGAARQISLPRGHCHHSGARQRRIRRQRGQDPADQRSDRRTLRLHRLHLRLVVRSVHLQGTALGRTGGYQRQAPVQG